MEHNGTVRLQHEIVHGKKLATEGAEAIWNWASPAGQKRANRRAQFLVTVGKISATDRVLEIGCGTGLFTRKIAEQSGATIIANDLSEELLAIARETNANPRICYEIGDAMNLTYGEGEFDVVCGSSILHHLNFDEILPEIFRVLKKGGRMVFAEPNMLNPQILIQKNVPFIKARLGDSPDETAVIRWKFAKQLTNLGFSNVRIFPYDFLHPATPVMFIPLVDGVGRFIEKIPVLKEIAGSVIIYAEK